MPMSGAIIYTRIPRPERRLIAEAGTLGIADLHEALGAVAGRMALMSPRMRPLSAGIRISGPAVTAYNYPGDNLMLHKALQLAEPGDVLVLTNGGGTQGALWGELAARYATRKGLAGVIVEGSIRDTDELRAMRFPVWSTAISPSHPDKRSPGAVNMPIVCDGALVNPGDVIVADGDGVLVVPRDRLEAVVEAARMRQSKEAGLKERIAAGESLFDIFGMQEIIDSLGIEVRDTEWRDPAPGDRTGRDKH